MIRSVIDTNVLVSALLRPDGPPAKILVSALNLNQLQACLTGEIYAEYDEVLHRVKFRRSADEIAKTLKGIREASLWVRPRVKIRACPVIDDNMFLECAEAAEASYVVTGNRRHFPERWNEMLIVAPMQLLALLSEA